MKKLLQVKKNMLAIYSKLSITTAAIFSGLISAWSENVNWIYVNVSLEKGLQDIPVVRLSLTHAVYCSFLTSMFTKGSFDLYVWVVSDSKHVFLQRHLSSHLRAVGDWVHILALYPPVSPWTREHYHRRDIDHISQYKCTSENCRRNTKSYSSYDAVDQM